ncbi:hypothetical protein ASPTUDRAFT_693673 [Aspergillus tubingensis CBS 134.48]|uniref:Xylanolytic transcriptional activator regulatory domain-containing protein n=1 Tax=Aspergillus tubingensis (strain CBS 134.48) TaxID=767770 RepID=A0A1L9N161_ASPTC|nr:hypothetical protein ASPTUDRAFT_693673 [Aspergillus tubingensis CBS 134.48]
MPAVIRRHAVMGPDPAALDVLKKGFTCTYEKGSLKNQRYISTLEDRLKELEKHSRGGPARAPRDIADPGHSLNGCLNSPTPPLESYPETQVLMQQNSRPSFQNEIIGTDATVIVPSLEDNQYCSSVDTSTMALVQSTMRATNSSRTTGNMPGLNIASNIDQFASPQHIRRNGQDSQGPEMNAFTLPTRRMADNFMSCFWNFTHPIYPILHKPTFVISYDSLWVPPTESFSGSVCGNAEDPIFLSTMNIVFAIGCQFSDLVAPGKRTSLADQFYQRSRALYDIDALDSASLLTVQMLLLTGLYLQSTKYASRCWHMIGLAIRTAQDIGIHIEHTRPSKTQLEREMRRRVWHNCVILVRLLALTFGRPNMISSNSSVPPPLLMMSTYYKTAKVFSQVNPSPVWDSLSVRSNCSRS